MDYKHCSGCKKNKKLDQFSRHKKRRDGYQSFCKHCGSIYFKTYYGANKRKHRRSVYLRKQENRLRNQLFIMNWLQSNACVDCGEQDTLSF